MAKAYGSVPEKICYDYPHQLLLVQCNENLVTTTKINGHLGLPASLRVEECYRLIPRIWVQYQRKTGIAPN